MIKITNPTDHLYHRYPGQDKPQPTYVELDPDIRELSADWNGEVGGAIPFSVHHGVIRRYSLPSSYLSEAAIADLLNEILPFAERVCGGYSEGWDGSNRVGNLSEDAQQAESEIFALLDDLRCEDSEIVVMTAADAWWSNRQELIELILDGADDEVLEHAIIGGVDDADVLEGVDSFIRQIRAEAADIEKD